MRLCVLFEDVMKTATSNIDKELSRVYDSSYDTFKILSSLGRYGYNMNLPYDANKIKMARKGIKDVNILVHDHILMIAKDISRFLHQNYPNLLIQYNTPRQSLSVYVTANNKDKHCSIRISDHKPNNISISKQDKNTKYFQVHYNTYFNEYLKAKIRQFIETELFNN